MALATARTPERRQLPMQELYAPELLSILVGAEHREFKVPRGLICSLSQYFEKAFSERWSEGQSGSLTLEEVDAPVFENFVGWLYSGRIDNRLEEKKQDTERKEEVTEDEEEGEESQPDFDAADGEWRDLFGLYVFADRYDTKSLRRAVMESIQVKFFYITNELADLPEFTDLAAAFGNLNEASPLYRFLLNAITYHYRGPFKDICSKSVPELALLPPATVAILATRLLQIVSKDSCWDCTNLPQSCTVQGHKEAKNLFGSKALRNDVCSYHEHETKRGQRLCLKKWKALGEQLGLWIDL